MSSVTREVGPWPSPANRPTESPAPISDSNPVRTAAHFNNIPWLRLVSASSWSPHLTVAVWIEFLYIYMSPWSHRIPGSPCGPCGLENQTDEKSAILISLSYFNASPILVVRALTCPKSSNSRSYSSQHILLHGSRTQFVGQLSLQTLWYFIFLAAWNTYWASTIGNTGSWALGLQTLSHTVPSPRWAQDLWNFCDMQAINTGIFFHVSLAICRSPWLTQGSWQHSALRLLGAGCVSTRGRDGRRTYKDKKAHWEALWSFHFSSGEILLSGLPGGTLFALRGSCSRPPTPTPSTLQTVTGSVHSHISPSSSEASEWPEGSSQACSFLCPSRGHLPFQINK